MKFSIITATYNCEASLSDTIQSIAMQDYPREQIEWIVVDGNSSDRTLQVIKESSFRPDRLLSENDNGIYDALNKGVAMARGDVVGFLHADDFLAAPNVLSRIACAFRHTGAEAVYGDLQYVRQSGSGNFGIVRHWESGVYHKRNLKWGWMPPHPTLYLKRAVYDRAQMSSGEFFDTGFSCSADYDFMLRLLAELEVEPAYLHMVLVKMRVGGISNRSLKHIIRKSREDWQAIRRNAVGGIGTLAWKNIGKLGQFIRKA